MLVQASLEMTSTLVLKALCDRFARQFPENDCHVVSGFPPE